MDRFTALNVFIQSAEAPSFAAAGRSLGLSASAVGKSIARLEDRLGVRLFQRSTRSIRLTTEGELFLSRCLRIFEELDAAEAELAQTDVNPKGRLRVSLPLIGLQLSKALSGFAKAYPDIELDLDFSDRHIDLIEEGFDVVLRTGDLGDSRLMTRAIGTYEFVIVGSPEYLALRGTPSTLEDLLQHACLHHRSPADGKIERWPFVREGKDASLDLPVAMTASAIDPLVVMAAQGLGLACVPRFTVTRHIAAGSLRQVLIDEDRRSGTLHLLWPSNRHLSPKIKAFVSFMAAQGNGSRAFDLEPLKEELLAS